MSAKIHLTSTEDGSSDAVPRERGHSLLRGAKPKYKTAKKAKEDGTTQVPLPELDEEESAAAAAATAAAEAKPADSESSEKPAEPTLSLDQQLKMKLDAEREEARLKKEAEDAQIAKDMEALGLDPDGKTLGGEVKPPSRRVSVRDQMRKSCLIQDVNPDTMTEDEMAEKIGSTFHSLWGAIGIKDQFAKKVGDIAGAIKDVVHVDIHPSEVLERNTAGFPRRRYRGLHHNINNVGAGGVGGEDAGENGEVSPGNVAAAAPSAGGRRGAQKQAVSDTFGLNPFHVLQLSSDEIDYFYGAFCEIGGAGPDDDAPSTITLEQMVDWFYSVEYRFKTKDLKRNDPILMQNIETVHYFDKKGTVTKSALIDSSLLQSSESMQRQPWETGGAETGATAASAVPANTDNISMSAKDVAPSETKEEAVLRKKKEFQELIKAQSEVSAIARHCFVLTSCATPHPHPLIPTPNPQLPKPPPPKQRMETGQHTSMTFLDFVLSMWNFLTADEVVMVKNIFEYIEVGLLGNQDPVGVIPLVTAEILGRIWHPEKKVLGLKKATTKRKKNKLAGMVKAMGELAYIDKKTGEKSIFLSNFVGWCQKNRSFGAHVMRVQMDIYACLMGHSFWKRQSKKRSQRFGVANLNHCLKDSFVDPEVLKMQSQSEMEAQKSGEKVSTKREDAAAAVSAKEEEEGDPEEEAEEGKAHGKTWEEVERERVEEARGNVLKKKSRIRLGKVRLW